MERGVSWDCPNFWVPLLTQKRVKLRTSGFVHIHRIDRNKSRLKISGKVGVHGAYSQGLSKTFREPNFRAHRAAIFAIAQLSGNIFYSDGSKVL